RAAGTVPAARRPRARDALVQGEAVAVRRGSLLGGALDEGGAQDLFAPRAAPPRSQLVRGDDLAAPLSPGARGRGGAPPGRLVPAQPARLAAGLQRLGTLRGSAADHVHALRGPADPAGGPRRGGAAIDRGLRLRPDAAGGGAGAAGAGGGAA